MVKYTQTSETEHKMRVHFIMEFLGKGRDLRLVIRKTSCSLSIAVYLDARVQTLDTTGWIEVNISIHPSARVPICVPSPVHRDNLPAAALPR